MKPPTERKYVSLRTEQRKDTGKPSHVLTYSPVKGERVRLTFTDQDEATAEADRIEGLFQHGHALVSGIPKQEWVMLALLCQQMLPGVPAYKVVESYIELHSGEQAAARRSTVKDVGEAFMLTRSIAASGKLSPTTDYSPRHQETIRSHVKRFIKALGDHPFAALTHEHYQHHLDKTIGGAPKTRSGHLITLRSLAHWARDVKKFLPAGPTAPDLVKMPESVGTEHEVYTAEEFTKLLIATPEDLLMFMVLGQFAGIRAQERERMTWGMWRRSEDNKLVLNRDVTKTKKRRLVDVLPNLAVWLETFRRDDDTRMVGVIRAHKYTAEVAKVSGVLWKPNALRSGFCSYHVELFDNSPLTAKNSGHSINELEVTYKSIKNVTKQSAREMFGITPQTVLIYAREHKLPLPDWAPKVLEVYASEA